MGPKKPKKPPEVKNATLNAQRQAEYERLKAVYEQHLALYKLGQWRPVAAEEPPVGDA